MVLPLNLWKKINELAAEKEEETKVKFVVIMLNFSDNYLNQDEEVANGKGKVCIESRLDISC